MLWHKGGENNKQNQKLRYTWTFSELQLLHHSRNAKYTPQVLETNTRRGLTSCFPCKSFQVTCAIWNVHLVSVSQKKHWTIPLCSHISSQVYDIRSLAPNTAAGWTHTSPELQGTSHTDCILQHRQGDLSLRSKTTNCRPFRNLHRFGTKQQVQEIISFKREVGVKLTFLSYLMLSPTAKRRLGGEAGGKVHLSLKMSSSYFFTSDQAMSDCFSFTHSSSGTKKTSSFKEELSSTPRNDIFLFTAITYHHLHQLTYWRWHSNSRR